MSATTAITHHPRRTPKRKGPPQDSKAYSTVTSGNPMHPHVRNDDLPKSASYTYLPAAKESAYTSADSRPITIKGDTSSEDLTAPLDSADVSPPDSSGWTTPSEEIRVVPDVISRLSAELEKIPRISIGEAESSSDKRSSDDSSSKEADPDLEHSPRPQRSFARRLSRRMSVLGSRSPSPAKPEKKENVVEKSGVDSTSLRPRALLKKRDSARSVTDDTPTPTPEKTKRKSNILGRKRSDQKLNKSDKGSLPGKLFLPKSFSTDKLHSVSESTQEDTAPLPSPRILNAEKNSSLTSLALPRKRDDLWSVFRQLDGDYAKFSSKSTAFKANVIRQSLLPFLKNYADHPSSRSLRAEDLDRRTSILNKWWMGLLDLLHGKNNQSLSGTDRPTILDALSGLMDRAEWRTYPSVFCPLVHRTKEAHVSRNKSSTSLASIGSEFITESVMHNVRNLFVQNLNAQMAFVAEKMSLRSASASLITFCGKAIAYAFYFCPGIAGVLVRMWHTDPDALKRVLSEYGVSKFDNLREYSDHISSPFPPSIHTLAFTSLAKMIRTLRQQVDLPPTAANIQFYGYWMERWLGRESDLLYVFVKHYFILANDYLPSNAEKKERIVAPAMLLVQAQILTNLDSIIHRDVGMSPENPTNPSPTFDDFLGGPDAVVSSLPLLPPNATRPMTENRIIMLIRDFLGDRTVEHVPAVHLFATTFGDLLHASARSTSIFNHAACYTLCDFFEEALVILVRYEQSPSCQGAIINSSFWLDVCRKMLTSQNTVTEIRLYAFLYSAWPLLCAEPERKEAITLGLLLQPSVFNSAFTHWCPMVRAYFLRLVCWRLGRYDGHATDLDTRILTTLFQRLRNMWSYHLFSSRQSESGHLPYASTAPCQPAPGRRFLVIRTDTQVAPGGSFLAFNGIMPPMPPTEAAATVQRRILSSGAPLDRPLSVASTDSDLDSPASDSSGLRGFLKGMLGGSNNSSSNNSVTANRKRSASRDAVKSASATTSPTKAKEASLAEQRPRDRRSASGNGNSGGNSDGNSRSPSRGPNQRVQQQHSRFSFKFSLEFAPKPPGHIVVTGPTRDMRLQPPRLPGAAMRVLLEMGEGGGRVEACDPKGTVVVQGDNGKVFGDGKGKGQAQGDGEGIRLTYVGRALAEWTIVVAECQGFFERRRAEGVPADAEVETPTLGVELFRRCG